MPRHLPTPLSCPRALSLALVIGPAVLSLLAMGCGAPPGEPLLPAPQTTSPPGLATAPRVSTLRELPYDGVADALFSPRTAPTSSGTST